MGLLRSRFAVIASGLTLAVLLSWAISSDPAASTAYRAAPMSTAGAARSTGCGPGAAAGSASTTVHRIAVGERTRSYRLHVPRRPSAGTRLPLLVAFHGHGRSAALLERSSHLSVLPAVVAYPDGVRDVTARRAWQGAPYARRGVDDLAFTRALLDAVESSVCIDLDRVYTVGHSNGGEFAALAACQLPGRVAATAVVSGAFYDRTVVCRHDLPVLELHGTADRYIPYRGTRFPGTDIRVPPIRRLLAGQARVNGCTVPGVVRRLSTDVTRVTYGHCDAGATVERIGIAGAGHRWPERTIAGLPAYARIWEFLGHHSL